MSVQRPVVRLERRLDHPIERVWRAVTEPAELARWFVAEANWKPELGETFEAAGSTGRITAYDPPRHFAWDWDIQSFSFELEPDGDGTRLVFTHVFDPKLVERANAAGRLRAEVHLTDDKGHPRCARVRPPAITWDVATEG